MNSELQIVIVLGLSKTSVRDMHYPHDFQRLYIWHHLANPVLGVPTPQKSKDSAASEAGEGTGARLTDVHPDMVNLARLVLLTEHEFVQGLASTAAKNNQETGAGAGGGADATAVTLLLNVFFGEQTQCS